MVKREKWIGKKDDQVLERIRKKLKEMILLKTMSFMVDEEDYKLILAAADRENLRFSSFARVHLLKVSKEVVL